MNEELKKYNETDYTLFWQDNLQRLDEISVSTGALLEVLEKEYSVFGAIYSDIDRQVKLLNSICASFNNISGREELLRLSAVIERYRRRYTKSGIDFELIYRLLDRAIELRNRGFTDFPSTVHIRETIQERPERRTESKKYNYTTFKRNGSWFIIPKSVSGIVLAEGFQFSFSKGSDTSGISASSESASYSVADFFYNRRTGYTPPRFLIFFDNIFTAFASDVAGKRIYSDTDIIPSLLRPYKKSGGFSSTSGRIRLFGKQHILLDRFLLR